jgi:hypothetical protein
MSVADYGPGSGSLAGGLASLKTEGLQHCVRNQLQQRLRTHEAPLSVWIFEGETDELGGTGMAQANAS